MLANECVDGQRRYAATFSFNVNRTRAGFCVSLAFMTGNLLPGTRRNVPCLTGIHPRGHMRRLICNYVMGLSIALIATTRLLAQADAPIALPALSPAATQAVAQHETALRDLRQAYFKTLIDADNQEIQSLDSAMGDAMTAHDLDGANQIRATKTAAELALKRHTAESLGLSPISTTKPSTVVWEKIFRISASEKWQPTIEAVKGQHLKITATGKWHHAPIFSESPAGIAAGVLQGVRDSSGYIYYLEGRINQGLPFGIGPSLELLVPRDGFLEMEMNDDNHMDNSGTILVTVELLNDGPKSILSPSGDGSSLPRQ